MLPQKRIKYKAQRNLMKMEYLKICLLIKLKSISKSIYIKCLLRKIKIAKILFIQELEMGQEVFIPQPLS